MIRQRTLSAIALATLLATPLAACTNNSEDPDPTAAPTTQEAPPADATTPPEERVAEYLEAFDAAAEEGWQDTSYNAEYLTPELAEKADAADAENRDTGATIEGERHLSNWTVLEQEETSVVVEFCQDTSEQRVMRDGEDQGEAEAAEVGRFTLTRESADDPWLIAEKGFYPKETTCADHFEG